MYRGISLGLFPSLTSPLMFWKVWVLSWLILPLLERSVRRGLEWCCGSWSCCLLLLLLFLKLLLLFDWCPRDKERFWLLNWPCWRLEAARCVWGLFWGLARVGCWADAIPTPAWEEWWLLLFGLSFIKWCRELRAVSELCWGLGTGSEVGRLVVNWIVGLTEVVPATIEVDVAVAPGVVACEIPWVGAGVAVIERAAGCTCCCCSCYCCWCCRIACCVCWSKILLLSTKRSSCDTACGTCCTCCTWCTCCYCWWWCCTWCTCYAA